MGTFPACPGVEERTRLNVKGVVKREQAISKQTKRMGKRKRDGGKGWIFKKVGPKGGGGGGGWGGGWVWGFVLRGQRATLRH